MLFSFLFRCESAALFIAVFGAAVTSSSVLRGEIRNWCERIILRVKRANKREEFERELDARGGKLGYPPCAERRADMDLYSFWVQGD